MILIHATTPVNKGFGGWRVLDLGWSWDGGIFRGALTDHKINKEDFLQEFITVFSDYEKQYQQFGFITICERWKNNAYKIGEQISLSNNMSGVFSGIDENGNLLLLDENQKLQKIVVAEILT